MDVNENRATKFEEHLNVTCNVTCPSQHQKQRQNKFKMFLVMSRKTKTAMSASNFFFNLDKLLKILWLMVKCWPNWKNLGEGQPRGILCQKKRGWMCNMDEKEVFYILMGWSEDWQTIWDKWKKNCLHCKMSATTSSCQQQRLYVSNNVSMSATTSTC